MILALLVFLSYSHANAPAAHTAARKLEAAGCSVWIDTRERAGTEWTRDVEAAIDRADVVVTLLSSTAYRSYWVRAEQLRAVRKNKRIIAVVVEPGADVPLTVEGLQHITLEQLTAQVKCK